MLTTDHPSERIFKIHDFYCVYQEDWAKMVPDPYLHFCWYIWSCTARIVCYLSARWCWLGRTVRLTGSSSWPRLISWRPAQTTSINGGGKRDPQLTSQQRTLGTWNKIIFISSSPNIFACFCQIFFSVFS